MSKILIVLFLLVSFSLKSQIDISILKGSINSKNSDLDFNQIDDTTAFFTSSYFDGSKQVSEIFISKKSIDLWDRNTYKNLNFENLISGNTSFDMKRNHIYFTLCDGFNNCDIYIYNEGKAENLSKKYPDVFVSNYNSQPNFFTINQQDYLSFTSNRKNGFGGLDIWFLLIDKDGGFGMPLNAGKNINSYADEITPSFDTAKSTLFFSSNDTNYTLGGFDIFYSKGIPNNWSQKKSMYDFNSKSDDLYFKYYNDYSGSFSSNRPNDNSYCDSCCSNIFTFTISNPEQPSNLVSSYSEFLPLNLYFDNDSPEIDTYNSSPINYKESYVNYFMKIDEYSKYNSDNSLFFEDSLKGNFNQLNKLLHRLHYELENGYLVDIKIKGYASQLADSTYNIELSSVRIKSLISYFLSFKNGSLAQFYNDDKLKISEVPLGESQIKSKPTQNIKKGIYGIDAILNRKVSILKIDSYK
jgi:hypothetical protein